MKNSIMRDFRVAYTGAAKQMRAQRSIPVKKAAPPKVFYP
jgi:hypothetical protein